MSIEFGRDAMSPMMLIKSDLFTMLVFALDFASTDQLTLLSHFFIRKIVIFYNILITIRK